MCTIAKKRCAILISVLAIFIGIDYGLPAHGQSNLSVTQSVAEARSAENPSGSESLSDLQTPNDLKATTEIDIAGEKVGQQIDRLTQFAASYLGDWINATLFAGISWLKLIISLLFLFVVLLIERMVHLIINGKRIKLEKASETESVKLIVLEAVAKPLSLFIWVYGIYFVLTPLIEHFRKPDGSNLVYTIAQKGADLGTAVALVWFIFKLVSIVDYQLKKWAASTASTIDDVLAPLLGKTLRVFIVIIGSLLIIQNLTGVKIGPLLASLGIGGLAVALAARDSIANFFGTLTILFDKPFQVGERVLIDSYDGVVEDVGFRSTRIRTLTGHLVTIPNEKLVNSGLENVSKRPHIRWLTNITITYDTPPDKVETAVAIIKEILENHEGMHPDFPPRVFFNGFNDWSLNIMVIAWYHPADYWAMQAWQQRTCLQILRKFSEAGIDFAFPSRTLYLANDDQRQLKLEILKGETATYIPQGDGHA